MVAAALVITVQGLSAAYAARIRGDPGPVQDGRATLNPLPHLDLLGLVGLLFFRAGWSRPVDVQPARFTDPRLGSLVALLLVTALVVAFGTAALVVRPLALQLIGGTAALTVSNVLAVTFDISVRSALLGLLPLQPLVGAYWLTVVGRSAATDGTSPGRKGSGAHPAVESAARVAKLRPIGAMVVLLVLVSGLINGVLDQAILRWRSILGY